MKWLSRVATFSKQASKGCLRRFIASLLIYSQFIQLSAAAVLPNSPPQAPLPAALQQGKPITTNTSVSAGSFSPLLNYAQTGTLNNLSLTSQQLGLSGPLNGGVTYSDLTGTYFNAQYVQPLGERLALSALGEYGSGQYRINGTLGYGVSSTAQMKFTVERFGQRLPFQFDSGDIESRVHQDAYGVRFQQLFNLPFVQGFNLGSYYADASSKNLNPVIFTSDGSNCGGFASRLQCINYRHLAGATSVGADAGIDVLLTPSTLVGGNLYYDKVRYNPIFSHTSDEDRNGLGGGVRLNQLLGERFKLTGEATIREIYDTYQAGFSWLPNFQKTKLGIELSLFGQHVTSHNATPDNNSIGLQVNFLADDNKRYDERHRWGSQRLSDIAQSVVTPAVKMNQVLVMAEQITKLLAPSIFSINPDSGPLIGGNTVTITGSNFVQGLLVFFGRQPATNIQIISPTVIKVVVPAGLTLGAVDVVIQNPDGRHVAISDGYTYIGTALTASNPNNATRIVGQTASFSTTASNGTSPYTYQWQVSTDGGTTFSNVSTGTGGTTASYTTVALVSGDNNNQYRVVVTDAVSNSVTTNAATLAVSDAITGVTVNDFSFAAGDGFPTIGFHGAKFTVNLESGIPSNYTWSSNALWVNVTSSGVVTFNSASTKPSSGSVTITATPIGGGAPLTYSFTLTQWFVNKGNDTLSQINSATYCNSLGGYSQPTKAQFTNASILSNATREIGNLWSEWGNMEVYNSGWHGFAYWSSTPTGPNQYSVSLDSGGVGTFVSTYPFYVACVGSV